MHFIRTSRKGRMSEERRSEMRRISCDFDGVLKCDEVGGLCFDHPCYCVSLGFPLIGRPARHDFYAAHDRDENRNSSEKGKGDI